MPEALPLLVGGSIAIDNVKTPTAEATNLLGGSASYASLAASYFTDPVHLVGVVGGDYPPEHLAMLERHGVSLVGVDRSEGASFTWSGEYHQNMNDRTTHDVAVNVLENWRVNLAAELTGVPVVVLANMAPVNQLEMIDQCSAPNRFVLADTMDLWINIAREELEQVLARIDLLVINETEAREYSGTSNLVEAGGLLRAKGPDYVVIKLGEFGAVPSRAESRDLSLWGLPIAGSGGSDRGGGYLPRGDGRLPCVPGNDRLQLRTDPGRGCAWHGDGLLHL